MSEPNPHETAALSLTPDLTGVQRHIAELEQQVQSLQAQLDQAQLCLQQAQAEQHDAKLTLQETQAKNRAFLQAIPDLIMEISDEGIYLDFIEAKDMDLLVVNATERLGKRVFDVLPEAIAHQYMQAIHQTLATHQTQTFEYQLQIHGKHNEYEARVVPSGDRTTLLIVRDITERKRTERALRLEREKSERLLLNILPQPIAERLKQQQSSIDRFDEATILFADIVGFTELSAHLTPTELVNLLNEIFSRFDDLADHHRLEKIKTIGDAYMVVGGIPTHRHDHAEAIADMALDMQRAIAQLSTIHNQPLQIRIGINTGPVIAGVIGMKKFIYDLWGDAVNIASRMESQGVAGDIQMTAAVYDRLNDRYYCEPRGPLQIKGKGVMMTYWLRGKRGEP